MVHHASPDGPLTSSLLPEALLASVLETLPLRVPLRVLLEDAPREAASMDSWALIPLNRPEFPLRAFSAILIEAVMILRTETSQARVGPAGGSLAPALPLCLATSGRSILITSRQPGSS
jgi:hypothetical protein